MEGLQGNVSPTCTEHQHITRRDAMEMTGRGDFKPYFTPIAEWVGPKHIKMLFVHSIRGLSAKIGETHANAITAKKMWARVMLAQMKNKWESGSERNSNN